jgi:hypothetical protein
LRQSRADGWIGHAVSSGFYVSCKLAPEACIGIKEYSAMLEWVGGGFDPEGFDLAAVNRALAALSLARSRVQ